MDPPKNSTKVAFGKLNVTLQGPLHECAPLLSKLRGFPDVHVPFPIRSELMDTVSILSSACFKSRVNLCLV